MSIMQFPKQIDTDCRCFVSASIPRAAASCSNVGRILCVLLLELLLLVSKIVRHGPRNARDGKAALNLESYHQECKVP